MKITQLYVYPIKSLRPISLPTATLCAQGLAYDRRYILLKPQPNGTFDGMFVGDQPEMALFHCHLSTTDGSWTHFTVSRHSPNPPLSPSHTRHFRSMEIPFTPDIEPLEKITIGIHAHPAYPAYRMPDEINTWFSSHFGHPVILAYLGDSLGIKLSDSQAAESWISTISPLIPNSDTAAINFSDGAPILLVSESSLDDLHPRLGEEKAVLEKFRPNVVVDGEGKMAWDEDFWGEVKIGKMGLTIVLTGNCARCTSINVDLDKGRMAEGESGKLLKKMMKDRRVDPGNKWEPVFGRYGFPIHGGEIRVGDEVVVSRRNAVHTVYSESFPFAGTNNSSGDSLMMMMMMMIDGVMPRLTRVEHISV
ncbi:MOSC domain-containing protein [Hyaloscypha hepaticicola]|uniref:MOSC domain-containing protein n=1 Tax=Hyaloscypha hepaticicola TaxID=2082293 RepID=A0A2J6QI44_9HELO|nr:MOSC domain-containing protein [Hyaloscypha hepaticicola]